MRYEIITPIIPNNGRRITRERIRTTGFAILNTYKAFCCLCAVRAEPIIFCGRKRSERAKICENKTESMYAGRTIEKRNGASTIYTTVIPSMRTKSNINFLGSVFLSVSTEVSANLGYASEEIGVKAPDIFVIGVFANE